MRRSRSLKFEKHGIGSGELHRERGPEICIRFPLKLVEYILQMHRVKPYHARGEQLSRKQLLLGTERQKFPEVTQTWEIFLYVSSNSSQDEEIWSIQEISLKGITWKWH